MTVRALKALLKKPSLSADDLITLLSIENNELRAVIRSYAYTIKTRYAGTRVYYRGLVEFSNECEKNCLYCGIRNGNARLPRYRMPIEEIVSAAIYAHTRGFGSVVLQSGESETERAIEYLLTALREIHAATNNELHITLSAGEHADAVYERFFASGAHRYLLRVESATKTLYESIHPKNSAHSFERRLACLSALRRIGFQTGTGVMIGLPGQTPEILANDLLFMQERDIDMIGMGPYIEHADAPLTKTNANSPSNAERVEQTLTMIALLRIMMKDVNIAATTALHTLDANGRERAFLAGANVAMPNLTPRRYRENYFLYDNKQGVLDGAEESVALLDASIRAIGEEPAYGEWGDSIHFKARTGANANSRVRR